MARPRAVSKGGAGYTPKSGPFAGTHFASEYAYRDARAVRAGYENYNEQRDARKAVAAELGHPIRYSAKMRRDPLGERDLHRAWVEGKRMGRAKTRSAKNLHRRQVDEALMDLRMQRSDFKVEEDYWNSGSPGKW